MNTRASFPLQSRSHGWAEHKYPDQVVSFNFCLPREPFRDVSMHLSWYIYYLVRSNADILFFFYFLQK